MSVERYGERMSGHVFTAGRFSGVLEHNGRVVQVPDELRALCAEYRAKGFEVFPPCGHTDERGRCLGHCAVHSPNPRGVCVVCGDEVWEDVS